MLRKLVTVLTVCVVITLSVLGLCLGNYNFSSTQQETLIILFIVCGASALYCFIVGEVSRNNSQMDKLWSLLPIIYTWIVAFKGGMDIRLMAFALVATVWGIRLTINFARKGAYRIKFWEGEEDYRWSILREKKMFQSKIAWACFDLFFISIYQNLIVLAICLPSVMCMGSTVSFGILDFFVLIVALGFVLLETAADEQQWAFYKRRGELTKDGTPLKDIEAPYNLGFNTTGLWGYMRHPNYLGEQGIWITLYCFTIGAGVTTYGIFSPFMIGPLFLMFLFIGSSSLGEKISSGKYPKYKNYISQVFKYLPIKKFDPNK